MQIILRAYKSAVKSFETPECLGSLSAVQNNYQQALVSLTQQKSSLCREGAFACAPWSAKYLAQLVPAMVQCKRGV